MQGLPHQYRASASGGPRGEVRLSGDGLPELTTTPPPQFGGPEGYWSPETLLTAAIADCFILTFRAIAAASRLEWLELDCEAVAVLDRGERGMRFTEVTVRPRLTLPADADTGRAEQLLHKAEHGCLVTASLSAQVRLEPQLVVEPARRTG